MAYATKIEMQARFGDKELQQLTDFDRSGAINDAVLTKAMDDANNVIDGYMGRYTLPLATVPAQLVRYGCDIARRLLYKDSASDNVKELSDKAEAYLMQIATGKITLNGIVPPVETRGINYSTPTKVFADVEINL